MDLYKHLSTWKDLHKIKVELILTDNVVNINAAMKNREEGSLSLCALKHSMKYCLN